MFIFILLLDCLVLFSFRSVIIFYVSLIKFSISSLLWFCWMGIYVFLMVNSKQVVLQEESYSPTLEYLFLYLLLQIPLLLPLLSCNSLGILLFSVSILHQLRWNTQCCNATKTQHCPKFLHDPFMFFHNLNF